MCYLSTMMPMLIIAIAVVNWTMKSTCAEFILNRMCPLPVM